MAKKKQITMVDNWQTGYKWFSTWAFAIIVFLATVPLPPEIVQLLPPVIQDKLTAIVAVCGLILRFVKQANSHAVRGHHDGHD
ncbi:MULTISPECIES: hypothetical protein [Moraxella]|uniref:Holin n=1 Tax=Moraxella lacunata TaxID=477 RepID=A0A1B8Q538_MORLA|nr:MULTISPECIES: hypothetical protein [Moraxella]MBE9577865.1 hypothetical protein [Moraxella sp. K1664]MBE9587287.1 hypothetical protein [Moraxella sp. K1630]MBE9595561.1 hypothetical protein [Moraxella sp. K2450]MDH9218147.1 hypothetical protein [Moraxella lacunata]MDI4481904.1 hypothetical protein [Moraxella lacunata]